MIDAAFAILGALEKAAAPVTTLAGRIASAVRAVARHPAWWARYARTRRHPAPGPGRDDGEELTRDEAEALGNLDTGRDVRTRT